MRFRFLCSLFLFTFFLNGCAPRANEISPSYISQNKYSNWDCDTLIAEKVYIDNALPSAEAKQDEAADRDALMVFLIGVPTSGGGIKGEVARLKGEREALRKSIRDKCRDMPKNKNINQNADPKLPSEPVSPKRKMPRN